MCDNEGVITGALSPSLWRTFRVLAHAKRLEVFRLLATRGPMVVKQVMAACRLDEPTASRHLRALQSRGLLAAEPQGRYVHYGVSADPLVPVAAPLLGALQAAVAAREPAAGQIQALTAFTHPRRLRIARALAPGPLDPQALRIRAAVPKRALYRHLDKLVRRGVVGIDEAGLCRLIPDVPGLAGRLLDIVLAA